ncbi:probable serine/threonine-protein kinase clkA isoform X2 [Leguminivora glycinivorella]|uniref:probable serine/threonine-protein kinase clkA isoform X2 n=1 Tax=Leguminivora glycinivorella TaxID=1035111 RepID=UPI00200FC274|nr:probable serine/threonine-protein kinase clkA isoform X2 [Leguminivora glycinivorella]
MKGNSNVIKDPFYLSADIMYTGFLLCMLVASVSVDANPTLSQRVLNRLNQSPEFRSGKVAKLAKRLVHNQKLSYILDMVANEHGAEAHLTPTGNNTGYIKNTFNYFGPDDNGNENNDNRDTRDHYFQGMQQKYADAIKSRYENEIYNNDNDNRDIRDHYFKGMQQKYADAIKSRYENEIYNKNNNGNVKTLSHSVKGNKDKRNAIKLVAKVAAQEVVKAAKLKANRAKSGRGVELPGKQKKSLCITISDEKYCVEQGKEFS